LFVYYHGPVQLNTTEVYPLGDLDANLAKQEIERCRELLKSRDDKVRLQAQLAIEFLEPLVTTLEDADYA
jgi:F0F1-type ATP synthase epsilon subunit